MWEEEKNKRPGQNKPTDGWEKNQGQDARDKDDRQLGKGGRVQSRNLNPDGLAANKEWSQGSWNGKKEK